MRAVDLLTCLRIDFKDSSDFFDIMLQIDNYLYHVEEIHIDDYSLNFIPTKEKGKKISTDKILTALMLNKNNQILKQNILVFGYKIVDKIILF